MRVRLQMFGAIVSLALAGVAWAAALQADVWPSPDTPSKPDPSSDTNARIAQAKPQPAAPVVAAPEGQTRPTEKVETINFENWILTCRELVDAPKKRTCTMTVALRNAERTVLSWTVRQNETGQPVSVIEILPGVSIAPGIRLSLDKGATPRKFPIEICEPTYCSASLPMDKAFVQEVSTSSKVSVVVTSSAGQPVTLDFPVKGFEKAYAKM